MADPRVRILKIKTGVVKRLAKEKQMYEKEAVTEKQRIEKFKSEGKDDHVLRKQEEVLQESLMMIPDCQRRLAKAYTELKQLLETEQDLNELADYKSASEVLSEVHTHLPKVEDFLTSSP